jgi:hypothetical protein
MVPELVRVETRDGVEVAINPLIDGIDAWYQTSEPNATVALAANAQAEVAWRIPSTAGLRGDVEFFNLMSEHTGRYTAHGYLAGTYDRLISNQPISVNCLAGTAQLPHEFPESIFMEAAGHINWTLRDISGLANNINLVGHGRRFINYDVVGWSRDSVIEAFRNRNSHPYYLTFDQSDPTIGGVSIAASATVDNATLEMTVPPDGDFICYGVMDDSDFPYQIEMFSGIAGMQNTSAPLRRELFAGLTTAGGGLERRAAQFPMRWRQPKRITRRTVLRFRITNLVAQANVLRLVFFGRKVYYNELGKPPMAYFPPARVALPVAQAGSGNWQGVQPGALGPWLQPPVAPPSAPPQPGWWPWSGGQKR